MCRLFMLIVLCGCFVQPAGAAPASPTARAKAETAYAQGAAAFKAKQFEVALRHFEDAYLLDPVPILLYNIARAHEELKHYEEASRYLSRYLDRAPPDAPDRAQVEQRLTLLRAAAQASKDAKDARAEAERARAANQTSGKSNWLSWTLFGTGGLFVLISLASWGEAADAADEANALKARIEEGVDNEAELRADRTKAIDLAEQRSRGAWVMGGLGVVAGALGWYFYEGDDDPAPVGVAPTLNGLSIYGRF
jgi:tetratricopeptide (TPR) repeat protein